MRGSAYESLIVLLFRKRKSAQILNFPDVFLTVTMFDANGEKDFLIIPADKSLSKCDRTSSIILGGIRQYLSLNGVSSVRFIL